MQSLPLINALNNNNRNFVVTALNALNSIEPYKDWKLSGWQKLRLYCQSKPKGVNGDIKKIILGSIEKSIEKLIDKTLTDF